MSKLTKLERLEQEAVDAKAAMDANLAQRSDLGDEARQLQARLREHKVSVLERLEAEARLKEIDAQLDRLRADANQLSDKQMKTAYVLFEAKKSLANAERIMELVKDPPGWMKVAPASLGQNVRHAKQVIRELTGR